MENSFYMEDELEKIGFAKIGKNVLISRKASIYGADKMIIGNNVRIDDFCILSGKITIQSYVHIAAAALLFAGKEGITLENFTCLSSRCAVYAESDDYSGNAMTNPTIPDEYRNVNGGTVTLHEHSLIGSGSTILPGVTVGVGTSVGSMSLVNKSLDSWGIYVGIPCKRIKERSKKLLELEKVFYTSQF